MIHTEVSGSEEELGTVRELKFYERKHIMKEFSLIA
jgi:hypothetical protein